MHFAVNDIIKDKQAINKINKVTKHEYMDKSLLYKMSQAVKQVTKRWNLTAFIYSYQDGTQFMHFITDFLIHRHTTPKLMVKNE